MAAQSPLAITAPATAPSRLGKGLRAALVAAVAFVGVGTLGCADAVTFSRSETARGRVLLAEGDSEEAAIIFANQVRRAPKNYKAHYHLGLARMANGRYDEAIRSFKTGLEVMHLSQHGQSDEQYRFYLVDALSDALAQHDPDGSQLAQIEQSARGDKAMKLLVALTYAKSGQPDSAITAFQEAINLDRSDPQPVKQFGLYLESIAQADAAEQQLRRAYRLNTQDEEVAAALRRLGVVPGPAILSATELSKPKIPLGPIPEVKWSLGDEEKKEEQKPEAQAEASPPAAPESATPANPPAARRGTSGLN